MTTDSYLQRGVSSDKREVHQAIANLSKGLYPNAFCKILPDVLGGSDTHGLLLHADTAGTKPSLAYIYWRETGDLSVWSGLAQDALVMNLDDMACVGAVGPFVVSSNIARNKFRIPAEVLSQLIPAPQQMAEILMRYGIDLQLAGGETADVGDIVRTIDVGYTIAARIARSQVIEANIRAGQVIVGFASYGQAAYETTYNSGMGCNGLTGARHDLFDHRYATLYPESYSPEVAEPLVYSGTLKLTDAYPGDPTGSLDWGRAVLSPTRTYLPLIKRILDEQLPAVDALIHCTGGGQTKCLKFAQPGVHIIKDSLLPVPELFLTIHRLRQTPNQELFQTFNMGHRLELYTTHETAKRAIELASELGIEAQVIGRVEASAMSKPELTIHYQGEQLYYTGD